MVFALGVLAPVVAEPDTTPFKRQAVTFRSAGDAPASLSGELQWLDRPDMPQVRPGAIVCHPDPAGGGSMGDRVVWALAQRLAGAGLVVLCFNFRPLEHAASQTDRLEQAARDCLGALGWLRRTPLVDPDRVCLVGYSFGAVAALQAAVRTEPRARAYVGVAFPLPEGQISLSPYSFVRHARGPLLFVGGDQDPLSNLDLIRRLTKLTGVQAQFAVVAGADHLFTGDQALDALGVEVSSFVRSHVVTTSAANQAP